MSLHEISEAPFGIASSDRALAQALYQGLDTPLSALRASVESLSLELGQKNPRAVPSQRLAGVLEEVERLGRNVRELCALTVQPVPQPLRCTLEEIVHAACRPLPTELRARVLCARCEPGQSLEVDGPLLAGCLQRLLENALEATEEAVLVVARRDATGTSFTVIDEASSALGPEWRPVPFRTTKPNHLGLGLTLTQRDVALLGGSLEFLSTPGGRTSVRISLPSKEPQR